MSQSEKSVFSRIIDRELPADIVFENERLIVIKSIEPKAAIHLLGITKHPFRQLHELLAGEQNRDLLWELLQTLDRIAADLGLDRTGYKLVTNVGEGAGQTVPHLHIHLLGGEGVLGHAV